MIWDTPVHHTPTEIQVTDVTGVGRYSVQRVKVREGSKFNVYLNGVSLGISRTTMDECKAVVEAMETAHANEKKVAPTMTAAERELIIFAVNTYGTGGHPMASAATVDYFTAEYVRTCMRKMADDVRINDEHRAKAALWGAE